MLPHQRRKRKTKKPDPAALGRRVRAMAREEEYEIETTEEGRPGPCMTFPFGGREGYEKWLKDTGRWFNVTIKGDDHGNT